MGWDEWKANWERRERIKNLQRDIAGYGEIIRRLQEIKRSYNTYKTQIMNAAEDWDSQYERYNALDLAPDIKVTDCFEGASADQLAIDVPQVIDSIVKAEGQVLAVVAGIYDQINKIDEYIEVLERQKSALQAQLNSLLGA